MCNQMDTVTQHQQGTYVGCGVLWDWLAHDPLWVNVDESHSAGSQGRLAFAVDWAGCHGLLLWAWAQLYGCRPVLVVNTTSTEA